MAGPEICVLRANPWGLGGCVEGSHHTEFGATQLRLSIKSGQNTPTMGQHCGDRPHPIKTDIQLFLM